MPHDDLSVVVPVWGAYDRYLTELFGLLADEGIGQVLIVVNGDERLARSLPGRFPSADVLALPERMSVGAARNAGLARVERTRVCFADADDLPVPGAFGRLGAALDAHPGAVLATGLCERLRDDGTTSSYAWPPPRAARWRTRTTRLLAQWGRNHLSLTTGAVIDTATLRRVGGFPDADLAEDGMLACVLAAVGEVIVLDAPTRRYRTHADGLCQRGHDRRTWARAYRTQRRYLASHQALPGWRLLAHAYAPVHAYLSWELARVARHTA